MIAALMQSAPSRTDISLAEADRIILSCQTSAPVKINDLAKKLGLTILNAKLPLGVSGKIFHEDSSGGSSGYVIHIASHEPMVRQRFTAAHEIAHYVLHRQLIGNGITDDTLYRSSLPSPIEAQANAKAADILMPWHLINNEVNKGVTDVQELAELFQVSMTAMSIRLGLPT